MDDISRYYEILGLKPVASEDEIKQAYRDLVKVWHPDRFAHDPPLQKKADETLKKINEAYQKILDYINKPHEEFSESDTEEQFERSEKSFKSDTTQSKESEGENYSDSQPPHESPEPQESSEPPKEPPLSGESTQTPRPWVRFWARTLDLILLSFPAGFLFFPLFPEFTTRVLKEGGHLIIGFILLPLTAVMEAFILAIFGNTPAKAILKTKITNAEGNNLSFVEAIKRSFYIYFAGYAMGIPFASFITSAIAYNKLRKQGKTSWDKKGGFIVSHGRIGAVRTISFILLFILINGFIGVLSMLDSPPKSSRTPKFSSVEEALNALNSSLGKKEEPISPPPKTTIKPPNEKVAKAQQQANQQEAEQEKRKHLFNYYFKSGVNYYKDKKYYEAIEEFSKAISNQGNAESYTYRGLASYKIGKPEEAIKDFTKAIKIDPSYKIAYLNRGVIFDNLGQYDKAIEDHNKAIEIDPSYRTAYFNRGEIYHKSGQINKAEADFKKACEMGDKEACEKLRILSEQNK